MVDLGLALTAVKATIDTMKKASAIAKEMGDIKLKQIIMELSSELLDVQTRVIELREEVLQLREQAAKRDLTNYKLKDGVYYKEGSEELVFCPNCLHNGKESVLYGNPQMLRMNLRKRYSCPTCKSVIGDC